MTTLWHTRLRLAATSTSCPRITNPAGLNQIYSLKYGTVPVVRATGGLDDTVEQFDSRTSKGTGFKFREYSGEAMLDALRAAATLYRDNPDAWQTVIRNGMAQDYSWTTSAREYGKVYERARQSSNRQQAANHPVRNIQGKTLPCRSEGMSLPLQ